MTSSGFSKKSLLGFGLCAVLIGISLYTGRWWLLGLAAFAGVLVGGLKLRDIQRYYFCMPKEHSRLHADFTDLTGSTLNHYYVHSAGRHIQDVAAGIYSRPPFDDDGVPLVDYGPGIGKQYNACTTAQCALEYWELFLQTNDTRYRTDFLKQADWLLNEQQDGKWHYRFENKARGLGNPWISAMAQGQGISVQLRAWQCTGNSRYREAAEQAFRVFEIPVETGGVSCRTPEGTWLEEYPTLGPPSHVLNGHIFALFGVWDLYRATNMPEASELFQAGITVLTKNLHRYDNGYWVLYDLLDKNLLVDANYMYFQIDQLRVLHAITPEPIFEEYAARWQTYQHSARSVCLVVMHSLRSRLRT